MAGPTIGRAEIQVDLDGKQFAEQARLIGMQAGKAAGFAYNKGFTKDLSKISSALGTQMAKDGDLAGDTFGEHLKTALGNKLGRVRAQIADAFTDKAGFSSFVRSVGSTQEAVTRLEQALKKAHAIGEVTNEDYVKHGVQINKWAKAMDHANALTEHSVFENKRLSRIYGTITKQLGDKSGWDAAVGGAGGMDKAIESLSQGMAELQKHNKVDSSQLGEWNKKIKQYSVDMPAAEEAARRFAEQSKRLDGIQKDLNLTLSSQRGWDAQTKGAGGARQAIAQLVASMKELSDNNRVSDAQLTDWLDKIDQYSVRVPRAAAAAREFVISNQRLGDALRDVNANVSSKANWDAYVNRIGGADEATRRLNADMALLVSNGRLSENQVTRINESLRRMNVELPLAADHTAALAENSHRLGNDLRDVKAALSGDSGWAAFQKNAGGAAEGTKLLNDKLVDLHRNHKITDFELTRLADKMNSFGINANVATKALDRHATSMAKVNKEHQTLYSQLPRGGKRIIFFTALFAAMGSEIAILGSVAGSSLAVLGTAALSVGVAGALAVAGFKGMKGPLKNIAPAARPAAIALKNMGKELGKLQDGIQGAMFKDLAGPFNNLTKALPLLQTGLNNVSRAVGIVFATLANALSSTRGIETMNKLLKGMEWIIIGLGDVAINLGSALGTIFVAALPATNAFVTVLEHMTANFAAFLQSAEGQSALADFFHTLQTVMPPIVDLLAAAGKMLASLVTPETISQFTKFLDNMTKFMPLLGEMLSGVAKLNIFGLISELLVTLGEAFKPIAPEMGALATAVHDLIEAGIGTIGPILGILVELAKPLIPILTDMANGFADWLMEMKPELQKKLDDFAQWCKDNPQAIKDIAAAIAILAASFAAVIAVKSVVDVIKGIAGAFSLLGLASLGPWGLALLAVLALAGGIYYLATQTTTFQDIWRWFDEGFNGTGWAEKFDKDVEHWFDQMFTNVSADAATFILNWQAGFVGLRTDTTASIVLLTADIKTKLDTFYATAGANLTTWVGQQIGEYDRFKTNAAATLSTFILDASNGFHSFYVTTTANLVTWVGQQVGEYNRMKTNVGAVLAGFTAEQSAKYTTFYATTGAKLVTWVGQQIAEYNRMKTNVGAILTGFAATQVATYSRMYADTTGKVVAFIGDIVGKYIKFVADLLAPFIGFADKWLAKFTPFKGGIKGLIDEIVGWFQALPGRILSAIGNIGATVANKVSSGLGGLPMKATAVGGVFHGAQARIIGEAGPEAVVPLSRPLSQVDPAVRALSAFAQGLSMPTSSTAAGRQVYVAPGAIVVQTVANPMLTASAVLDRLVASAR